MEDDQGGFILSSDSSGQAHDGPRVAVFGYFGEGNFGNEASLDALLTLLADAGLEAQVTCLCHQPDRVRSGRGLAAVPISSPHRPGRPRRLARVLDRGADLIWMLGVVGRHDAVVVPGTGLLEALYARSAGVLTQLALVALAARIRRRPLMLISVGADRHRHRGDRWSIAAIRAGASYLTVRDDHSAAALRAMAPRRPRPPVRPDLVIGTGRVDPAVERDPRLVAVGVMAYAGGVDGSPEGDRIQTDYLDRLTPVVTALLADGWTVRLIGGDDDDLAVAERLRAGVLDTDGSVADRLQVADGEPTMAGVLDSCARARVVVATRYHNVIGALMTRTPVLSIGYADKNAEALRTVGLGEYAHRVEDFDPEFVTAQLRQLLADIDTVIPTMAAAMAVQEGAATGQAVEVTARLRSAARRVVTS